MTEKEVEKYIAQLAFSGAKEFMEKLEKEGKGSEQGDIIGKFGLGFYSHLWLVTLLRLNLFQ